jgi:cytochrome b subunit of formate dehydrogenase
MPEAQPAQRPAPAHSYVRFSLWQRLEHLGLFITFTTLGVTGLAQKYAASPGGEAIIALLGGIETSRLIHRSAAVGLMIVSVAHIIGVLHRIIVRRTPLSMMPTLDDFKHLGQDILYYLGQRARKAFHGRFTYAEKVEYFAVVWGTLIMAITGFMMWNPIATARLFPGQAIPAAKAAHGGEALLAVLAIILWHFYHVHLRHFNRSIFTGRLSRREMEAEHPAELQSIDSGLSHHNPPPEVLLRRERLFLPVAAVLTVLFALGIYRFITFEETAIQTLVREQGVPVFVPFTPTPASTPLPATPIGAGTGISLAVWEGGVAEVMRLRCGNCHGLTAVGGLSLATYAQALEGGVTGPAIVPGDPQASVLLQVQAEGTHPGQLTPDELNQIRAWIAAGAPLK